MDWIPGVVPTGKRVEVPVVAIRFRDGKQPMSTSTDQASVLVQLGLLNPGTLPVVGIDSARKAPRSELALKHINSLRQRWRLSMKYNTGIFTNRLVTW